MISVIIPALNEADSMEGTLRAIFALDSSLDVIVADGGSADGTVSIASSHGARVVQSGRGCGLQLARGAEEAHGEVLWFVHADTLPHPGALADIEAALRDPCLAGGNFRLRFDGHSLGARFLNRLQGLREILGWHYGDNTIFVRRGVYSKIGGCRPGEENPAGRPLCDSPRPGDFIFPEVRERAFPLDRRVVDRSANPLLDRRAAATSGPPLPTRPSLLPSDPEGLIADWIGVRICSSSQRTSRSVARALWGALEHQLGGKGAHPENCKL
jgi:glycosyltransferase involved in cell wall biosynthesis